MSASLFDQLPAGSSSGTLSQPSGLSSSAVRVADAIGELLADPTSPQASSPADRLVARVWQQSLGHGALGTALLHIERAASDRGGWETVHAWLATAMAGSVTTGTDSHPHYGAPALAHVLACAAEVAPGRYTAARHLVEQAVRRDFRQRLGKAEQRLAGGGPAALSEYDAIRGLTGLGIQLLHREPDGADVRAVLGYLVRLTASITVDGRRVPGWWAATGPSGTPDAAYPHGHANNGLAHGIAGPLALLALAARYGVFVPGHHEAIHTITTWLSRWQSTDCLTLPAVLTLPDITGPRRPERSLRPSWCYGAAGLARAQQLAGIAMADDALQRAGEGTITAVLDHSPELEQMTEPGLCHGLAGLLHASGRIAADASAPTAARIRELVHPVVTAIVGDTAAKPSQSAVDLVRSPHVGADLLDGATGIALALYAYTEPARTGWSTFMVLG